MQHSVHSQPCTRHNSGNTSTRASTEWHTRLGSLLCCRSPRAVAGGGQNPNVRCMFLGTGHYLEHIQARNLSLSRLYDLPFVLLSVKCRMKAKTCLCCPERVQRRAGLSVFTSLFGSVYGRTQTATQTIIKEFLRPPIAVNKCRIQNESHNESLLT